MISRLLLLNWPSLLCCSPSMAKTAQKAVEIFLLVLAEVKGATNADFGGFLGNLEVFEGAVRFCWTPTHVALLFALPSPVSKCISGSLPLHLWARETRTKTSLDLWRTDLWVKVSQDSWWEVVDYLIQVQVRIHESTFRVQVKWVKYLSFMEELTWLILESRQIQ